MKVLQIRQAEQSKKIIFILAGALCFTPFIDPSIALLAGFVLTLLFGNPFLQFSQRAVHILLQVTIVGLGFGMNVFEAGEAGKEGFIFTVSSIVVTVVVGLFLGKIFATGKKTNLLISIGTAICGGSAIAAISPVIRAKEEEISISLATIFILNSLALFIFPVVGEYYGLSQNQFGLWSAIAIHDTSSVVGAAQKYGEEALKIATAVKLERALWIIPVSLIAAFSYKSDKKSIKIPYFILLFVLAMVINTFVPTVSSISQSIVFVAKKGLNVTLFLIGAGLTVESIKKAGVKTLLQGVILWVLISAISLWVILRTVG